MQTIEIIGQNYYGHWDRQRTACRGIVRRGAELLISYETRTGQFMIPGGGLEAGETPAARMRAGDRRVLRGLEVRQPLFLLRARGDHRAPSHGAGAGSGHGAPLGAR